MILVDLNQVMIANLMQQIGFTKKTQIEVNEDLIRHMVLNSIRLFRSKFGNKYGELIICCDDTNNWRKDHFPYYKMNRKKDREESSLDWDHIFSILNKIRDEIREYLPYKVIRVSRAEADDVIATICHEFGSLGIRRDDDEDILILSSDKDFVQLQKYANVTQYAPAQKKFVNCNNPARFIHEHIMRGDRGDGVPNFLSDDDTFVVDGKRQKQLAQKKIDNWNGMNPKDYCDEKMMRGYKRNDLMVNLDNVPENIQKETLEQFSREPKGKRGEQLRTYFVKNKLKHLMENITEF